MVSIQILHQVVSCNLLLIFSSIMFECNTNISCFLFIILFSFHCHGYTFLQPSRIDENFLDKCIDENWDIHRIGSVWYDKEKCEQLECVSVEDELYIQGYGCGKIVPPKDCWLIPGKGVNYPSCCPDFDCFFGVIW
ncbi:toxin-like protein 14 [Nephila pilipes]|uniref:Toxin-like protein 14 n=1 Tax=Nephila pilipes TaxID=299642 RepID=A0A8X6UPR8_NEPPI|nr:toxin-like protein 14 [Nephila pilipes]